MKKRMIALLVAITTCLMFSLTAFANDKTDNCPYKNEHYLVTESPHVGFYHDMWPETGGWHVLLYWYCTNCGLAWDIQDFHVDGILSDVEIPDELLVH